MLGVTLVTLVGILAAGCGPRTAGPVPKPAAEARQTQGGSCPRVVVAGLDRTGSYALAAAGRRQVAEVILRFACPGDVWYVRWISNDSYSDRNAILTLRLPALPAASSNPFDRRSRLARDRQLARLTQAKRAAAARLMKLDPAPVIHTDIWGFLAKAAVLLASVPGQVERVIILASDLSDTLNRRVPLDLAGGHVYVAAFQSGQDPAAAMKLRAFWEKTLAEAGVVGTTFVDPSQTLAELWAREMVVEGR